MWMHGFFNPIGVPVRVIRSINFNMVPNRNVSCRKEIYGHQVGRGISFQIAGVTGLTGGFTFKHLLHAGLFNKLPA